MTRPWNSAHNAYVSHDYSLLVFWSQKAAYSATTHWFSSSIANVSMRPTLFRTTDYCIPYQEAMQYVDKGYSTVFVCRNPYKRSVSAYINKFYFHPEYGKFDRFDKLEVFSKPLYRVSNLANPFLGWSFDQYLRTVRLQMFKFPVINGHWETQIPRSNTRRFEADFLVRVENYTEDLLHVIDSLQLPAYEPTVSNRTAYEAGFRESADLLDKISSLQLLQEGVALRPHNLLSADAKALIRYLYAEDFEYFGYNSN